MSNPPSEAPKGNILIVDDKPDNLRLLAAALTERNYKVRSVINGSMALMGTKAAPPDLILLDVNMPEMNGYEVCQALKADEQTREIPVIFISALDEVLDKVRAFAVGGVDYIPKPFHFEEVLARIENQLTIRKLQKQLQEKNLCLLEEISDRIAAESEVRQLNAELEQRVNQRTELLQATNRELKQEIIERKRTQKKLLDMALHDALTGLPNRTLFVERLNQALQRAKQEPNYLFAVLFLDCDRFKMVNDSLGHLVGDQLLIELSKRLTSYISLIDTLARLGGDEFAILLEEIENVSHATQIADKIINSLKFPFFLEKHEVFINASIGIALSNKSYNKPEHLLRDADLAMYRAKAQGKACYQVFDTVMHDRALELLQLENDLRRAVERQEFLVNYQPIISLAAGKIAGFEALVRWHHPERGLVSPLKFIPTAEESGLIIPIGQWILQEACRQLRTWQNLGINKLPLTMSVNLAVKQFSQADLIQQIDKILQETELDGHSLRLEITESAILDNSASAKAIIKQLKSRQIQLSIDDFGTGYSSLSYLHRFPVDILKIDRSFVSRISETGENMEIVRAIVTLAHNLGMTVVAEGVETAQQLSQLRNLGCEYAQGYFFSKPLDSLAAEAMIASAPQW